MGNVIVLGSANMDIVIETERLPKIGETLLGKNIDYYVGGKGANQAVAASRTGAYVSLIGRVGNDTFGEKVFNHLKSEGIDVEYLHKENNIFTGVASVFKLPSDNAIVVLPGANMLLLDIEKNVSDIITSNDVLLCQLEIPMMSVQNGLKIAKDKGAFTILNPAPYDEGIMELLPFVDVITPNEVEFEGLIGHTIENKNLFEQEMITWSRKNRIDLIVTRGDIGVSYTIGDKVKTIEARKIDVVDTTGAGDTFNGILAACLAKQVNYSEAIEIASIGATMSISKLGAQTGMPTLEEIYRF